MANLPQKHPHLSLHLTDAAMTPLVSSARSQNQLSALASLSRSALAARDAAARLGLGAVQRVVIEHQHGADDIGPGTHRGPKDDDQEDTDEDFDDTEDDEYDDDDDDDDDYDSIEEHSGGRNPPQQKRGTSHSNKTQQQRQQHQHQQHQARTHHTSRPGLSSTAIGPTSEGGPVVVQSFLSAGPLATPPMAAAAANVPVDGESIEARLQRLQLTHAPVVDTGLLQRSSLGVPHPPGRDDDDPDGSGGGPPLLLGLVVAPSAEEALEARRAAARLERVGRAVQSQWVGDGDSATANGGHAQPGGARARSHHPGDPPAAAAGAPAAG